MFPQRVKQGSNASNTLSGVYSGDRRQGLIRLCTPLEKHYPQQPRWTLGIPKCPSRNGCPNKMWNCHAMNIIQPSKGRIASWAAFLPLSSRTVWSKREFQECGVYTEKPCLRDEEGGGEERKGGGGRRRREEKGEGRGRIRNSDKDDPGEHHSVK